jgi:hypothetical protein
LCKRKIPSPKDEDAEDDDVQSKKRVPICTLPILCARERTHATQARAGIDLDSRKRNRLQTHTKTPTKKKTPHLRKKWRQW